MKKKLQLSDVEKRIKFRYGIIYHTGHGTPEEPEVELLTEETFTKVEDACAWMTKNVIPGEWVNPEVVEVVLSHRRVRSLNKI